MPNHPVLILDDDEHWLARHELRLTRAGIHCFGTQNSNEAIKFAKENEIKIALIDEILFVPPVIDHHEGELQRWQGRGVIREIINHGLDTLFIFITSAPSRKGNSHEKGFWQELGTLKKLARVIEVINKQEITYNPEDSYERIINTIKHFNQAAHNASIFDLYKPPFTKVSRLVINLRIKVRLALFNINLDRKTNMTTTNWMLPNNKGILNVGNTFNGNYNGVQNNYSKEQDLKEAAKEIQAILESLSQEYPIDTEAEKQRFALEFQKQASDQPILKEKVISALKSGGKEALKQLCSHPAVDIAIAVYEGWNEPA